MTDPRIERIREQRRKERSSLIWHDIREALTGRVGAASTASPTTGLSAGYIWTHSPSDQAEIPALNPGRVSDRISGARVLIGERWSDGLLEVITLEALLNSIAYGGAIGAVATPTVPAELQPFGAKSKEFLPTLDATLGGLYLYVNSGWYNGRYWAGGRILMTPTATALKQSYYVVGFDESTGSLVGALSADQSLAMNPLPYADITAIWETATFADARPIAAVRLANGVTTYAHADIVDIRDEVAVGSPGGASGGDLASVLIDADGNFVLDADANLVTGA